MILLDPFGLAIKDTLADQITIKGPIHLSGQAIFRAPAENVTQPWARYNAQVSRDNTTQWGAIEPGRMAITRQGSACPTNRLGLLPEV